MRRVLAVAVAVLAVCSTVQAARVKHGLKFAINMASQTGDYENYTFMGFTILKMDKSRTGIAVGPTMEIPMSDTVSLETGLIMSVKGAKGKMDGDADFELETDVEMIQTWAEVPILAKVYLGGGGAYANIGFTAGVNINESVTFTDDTGDVDFETLGGTKPFELSFVIGAGASFKAGEGDATLGVQYQLGLTDVTDSTLWDETGEPYNAEIKNNVLAITFGVTF